MTHDIFFGRESAKRERATGFQQRSAARAPFPFCWISFTRLLKSSKADSLFIPRRFNATQLFLNAQSGNQSVLSYNMSSLKDFSFKNLVARWSEAKLKTRNKAYLQKLKLIFPPTHKISTGYRIARRRSYKIYF